MARKPLDSDASFHRSRSAANARERIRMRVLSRAFTRLKMCLPWVPKDTKLSKLDTLRLATCYIRYLMKQAVTQCSEENGKIPDCAQMIWPSRQSSIHLTSSDEKNMENIGEKEEEEDKDGETFIDDSF